MKLYKKKGFPEKKALKTQATTQLNHAVRNIGVHMVGEASRLQKRALKRLFHIQPTTNSSQPIFS